MFKASNFRVGVLDLNHRCSGRSPLSGVLPERPPLTLFYVFFSLSFPFFFAAGDEWGTREGMKEGCLSLMVLELFLLNNNAIFFAGT